MNNTKRAYTRRSSRSIRVSRSESLEGWVCGRLKVVRFAGTRENGPTSVRIWECKCSCGSDRTVILNTSQISAKLVKSCGCIRKEKLRAIDNTKITGGSGTRAYSIWNRLKKRHPDKLCKEWFDDFKKFEAGIGTPPENSNAISMIDEEKGFCPGNIEWKKIPTSLGHKITYNGETHNLLEWSDKTGIKYSTLFYRYKKGLPPDQLLRKPTRLNTLEYMGKVQSAKQWARELGISYSWLTSNIRDSESLARFISNRKANK